MRILIDGYNYLHFLQEEHKGVNLTDFEGAREKLISLMSQYRKYKPNTIIIVFDGTHSYNCYRSKESQRGVTVFFSAQGERADDVLMDLASCGDLVVTADREIRDFVEKNGAESIIPADFHQKVSMASMMGAEKEECDNDDPYIRPVSTKKKGNPKRKSKKARKAERYLRKL